jgi:hypothetical protein
MKSFSLPRGSWVTKRALGRRRATDWAKRTSPRPSALTTPARSMAPGVLRATWTRTRFIHGLEGDGAGADGFAFGGKVDVGGGGAGGFEGDFDGEAVAGEGLGGEGDGVEAEVGLGRPAMG